METGSFQLTLTLFPRTQLPLHGEYTNTLVLLGLKGISIYVTVIKEAMNYSSTDNGIVKGGNILGVLV